MDIGETLKTGSHQISFRNILLLFGLAYVGFLFISGELFFEVPNNWFITWMAGVFQQMDGTGFFNVWSGQIPGFNYLYFFLWKFSEVIAGGQYYFSLTFSLLWIIIDIGSLFLGAYFFYKIVEQLWGKQKGTLLGTVYLLFFFTMNQWYTIIDPIPIAGLLAAVYFSIIGRSKLGGALLGITATLKPLGLLLLPVILKSEFLTWKSRITIIISSLVSFLVVLLPMIIGNFKYFMSSFNWQSGRPPWETIYSFIMWLAHTPYPDNSFFQDASGVNLQDWGLTGITPPNTIMTTPVPSFNPWYNMVFMVLMIATMVAFVLFKRVRIKEDLITGILCLLAAYFTFFYGWSLQFVFWLIPFTLISFPLVISIILRLLVLLEYPFFYGVYFSRVAPEFISAAPGLTVGMTAAISPLGSTLYWGTIIIRTALILALGIILWRRLHTYFWNPISDIKGIINTKFQLQSQIKGG